MAEGSVIICVVVLRAFTIYSIYTVTKRAEAKGRAASQGQRLKPRPCRRPLLQTGSSWHLRASTAGCER